MDKALTKRGKINAPRLATMPAFSVRYYSLHIQGGHRIMCTPFGRKCFFQIHVLQKRKNTILNSALSILQSHKFSTPVIRLLQ